MNSEESILKIKIFNKDKSFDIISKDLMTLEEIKEKSINYFKINSLYKNLVQFLVKNNRNGNDDKIYISTEEDIIKNSIEKDQQNLEIELLLTFDNDKGTKTIFMNKGKDKNNKSINDNNIKNEKEKNTLKIFHNEHICIEGNMIEINELNKEIIKYKKYKEDYLKLEEEMQILKYDLENCKIEKGLLEEEKIILTTKINKLKKDLELITKKKTGYIQKLEEEINKYKNSIDRNKVKVCSNKTKKISIKEEKMIDINIQRSLEKSSFKKQNKISIKKSNLRPKEEESSSIHQNKEDSKYNNKNDSNPVDSNDKGILGRKQNSNGNSNKINIKVSFSKNDKRDNF